MKDITVKLHEIDRDYQMLKEVREKANLREIKIGKLPKWKYWIIKTFRRVTNNLINKWI